MWRTNLLGAMGTWSSLSFYFSMQSSPSLPLVLSQLAFAHGRGRLSKHQFHKFPWFPLTLPRPASSPLLLTPPYSFYKPISFIPSCLRLMYLWILLTPPPLLNVWVSHPLTHSSAFALWIMILAQMSLMWLTRIILTLCILQLPPYLFSPFSLELQLSSFACLSFIYFTYFSLI